MKSKLITPTLFALIFSFFAAISLSGQDMKFNQKFQEANRLVEENELNQAFLIWTELAIDNPKNANVNYKAGRAYLNTFSEKTSSKRYLKRAIENGKVSEDYRPFSPFETNIPIETYYYYAKSLHLNYDLEKAGEYYETFLKRAPSKHYLGPEAELGMKQVDNAKVLMKVPVEFDIKNLGDTVNTRFPDFSPVISVDENALFYTSARIRPDGSNIDETDPKTGLYYEDIYASYKDRDGNWQKPELLSINTPSHTATVNVSADGQTLYFYQDIDGNGDLYKSKLIGETWSEVQPMTDEINTKAYETHMAITPDEQTIYYVSDRKGGIGERDIYITRKLPDGTWGQSENIGAPINTKQSEDAVFISPDGNTLYFSSEGHNSMGGFDIFYSQKQDDDSWGEPVNIGYPINTTDDDVFFVTSADGKRAYYSSERESGYGEKDIYQINLPEPQEVNLAVLKGLIIPAEGEEIPDDILVNLTNKSNGEVQTFTPRKRDGVFVAILPPCSSYKVEYMIDGSLAATDTFSIECDIAYEEIYKELLISPLKVKEDGSAVVVSNTSGDAVPATFKRSFGYNKNIVSIDEEMFANFMAALKRIVQKEGSADIFITGSASKVPTQTFKNNQELADLRAEKAKKRILKNVELYEIDPSKLNFKSVMGKVQGPDYANDPEAGKEKYENYQYIEMKAE